MEKFSKKHEEVKKAQRKNRNIHLAIWIILISTFIILSISVLMFALATV